MQTSLKISEAEFRCRTERLLDHLKAERLPAVVLFDRHYVLYYTGFATIPTERPIAFAMNASGEKELFVPRLEAEHAKANAVTDRVDHYPEYPGHPHPLEIFRTILSDMGVGGSFGADMDGYPWLLGYRGPSLSELTGSKPKGVTAFIDEQMMIKSPAELALIRESAKWGHLAHTLLQRYTKVGATETEVSLRATSEATLAMLDTIGPLYRSQVAYVSGAMAGFRGQIGRRAAIPHSLAQNITFRAGDVVISRAPAPVWGYNSELERTMIIGPASDEQRQMFEHMVTLQNTAFAAMKPGAKCADVDRAVRAYYEEQDLMSCWRHHTGHSIGLRYHEGPFLDMGDPTELRPGMVFTVEPGLYVAGLGGFRHSDTVAITEEGIEIMTYYARDLESLTVPV